MDDLTFRRFNAEYSRLYKEEDGLYHQLAKHFGLSHASFWLLYALEEAQRPITQAELREHLFLSKQTINSALKGFEQSGHIRLSDGPGRNKYLHLTETGRALAERTVRPVLELEERAFQGMSPEERAGLLELYRRHLDLMRQAARAILDISQEG